MLQKFAIFVLVILAITMVGLGSAQAQVLAAPPGLVVPAGSEYFQAQGYIGPDEAPAAVEAGIQRWFADEVTCISGPVGCHVWPLHDYMVHGVRPKRAKFSVCSFDPLRGAPGAPGSAQVWVNFPSGPMQVSRFVSPPGDWLGLGVQSNLALPRPPVFDAPLARAINLEVEALKRDIPELAAKIDEAIKRLEELKKAKDEGAAPAAVPAPPAGGAPPAATPPAAPPKATPTPPAKAVEEPEAAPAKAEDDF